VPETNQVSVQQELEAVLDEHVASARNRQMTAFDEVVAGSHSIVIFGAGSLGRKILPSLRRSNGRPILFSDNNRALWNERIDGAVVLSPETAARNFASAGIFLITIWHPSMVSAISTVSEQLAALGCGRVATFPLALWKYSESLLPYYLWGLPSTLLDHAEEITSAFSVFEDEASRLEFVQQIRLRSYADFHSLSGPSPYCQYFPPDIVRLRPDECFIDCGAYNGDSVSTFLDHCKGEFTRIVAFEPDTLSFEALQRELHQRHNLSDRAIALCAAVGASNGVVPFNITGLPSAAISTVQGSQVTQVALDDVLCEERPTFIKMDIEGAELEALKGARSTIEKHRPLLAVCVYHRPDHLWRIPLYIRELLPDSQIYLRPHCADGFDVVCYAVPPERAAGGSR
jgi:FkbM family methyltransferase